MYQDYWLRPVGFDDPSGRPCGMRVNSIGGIYISYADAICGVRPAFNLSTSNVIYATAASVSSDTNSFTSVNSYSGSKPAYKLYIKTKDYVNYNETIFGAPHISITDNNVVITKTGQNGNAILLLSDKSGNGQVAYQATVSFDEGVAKATLPSGIKVSEYSITVLFADNVKGGEFAEQITGSFTDFGFAEPIDISSEYNGLEYKVEDILSGSETSWFDSTKMRLDALDGVMKDVNVYKIKATITSSDDVFIGEPDTSKGESADNKERVFTFTITKKKVGVNVALNTSGLPAVTLKSSGDIFSGDNEANGRAPNLGFNYVSSDGKGYNSDELPTAVGKYTATAKILNECNYELDDAYSVDFEITKQNVPKPTISGQSSKQYTGEDITFTMTGGDNSNINISLPAGMTRNGNTLTAKKAGQYKVVVTLADNGAATQWPDGSIGAIELDYEITKKPLGITITCDAADFTWNVGERPTVKIIGDSYQGDSTELYIYYIDSKNPTVFHDDINNDKVIDGKTRTIKMPGDIPQGSYTIVVKLYGDSKDNANYSLAVEKTASFTVKGNKVTVDDEAIKWKYNSTLVGNPSDPVKLVYSGNEYRFSVDEIVLADHGAKIDISKGINGYSGDTSVSDAKSGLYYVTVYLTNLDSSYESYNAQYTIHFQIDKAKYDLSGLNWPSVNTLEYNGKAQGMELQGSLPTGLTVSYSGNGKVPVGSYTTTATFSVGSNYVNNYYLPSAGTDTYEGDFEFTFGWSIIKATLSVSWKDDNNGSSEIFKLPTLKSIGDLDVNSMVDYTYYDKDNNIVTSLPTQVTEEMTFNAVATLKSAFAGNYQFEGTTNEYTFTIGKDKYAVTLILKWDGKNIDGAHLPYKGSAYTPTIEITKADGGIVPANITLTYYKDGSTSGSTDAPAAVGKYRVEATLNYGGDLNYIDSDSAEFEFEITKADLDVSGLKWEYTHGETSATYDFA
ncbi:MAG: hypothetical protein K2N53_06265, partial [Clostridia bacterium]|nr:hypothetical protein [Clostridia bacterium]